MAPINVFVEEVVSWCDKDDDEGGMSGSKEGSDAAIMLPSFSAA
jgi:hypothetical protein